ncbi:peptide chain release factor N(5)-glutamine methyltransferase [Emticicia sp. W12TSBA100-4]|uniref:peptide chain release factor N(5)-glutamine methyltransferase n=1 Tax=Emticicia sp. W12TSBA100-4 TaxID=3160965 RepID=UPI0033066CEA
MQSSKQLYDNLLQQITAYESQEAKEIVFWLMEFYLGLRKIDILSDKSFEKAIDWATIIERLNTHEPIQYILGETEFYGRRFLVNDSVLIPRPETEELVKYIVDKQKNQLPVTNNQLSILDIGTGSGCIAISLAKELPNFKVTAYDISEKALETAKTNAELNKADVTFEKVDILSSQLSNIHYPLSIIVSNPPYVTKQEIDRMQKNVLDFEPHLALFVEDSEPLIFYEAIANFAFNNLTDNGLVAVEINEALGEETAEVFRRKGFSEVEIIKDIHQKDRFVSAVLHKKDGE